MTVPSNENRYGDFATRQLSKYGWKTGAGLGREGEGITRAISITKKDDAKGLGSGSDTWGFAWWDHVYNKSSSAIKVEKGDEGVMLSTTGKGGAERNRMGIISTERPSKHKKEKKEEKKEEKKKEKKKKEKKKEKKDKKKVEADVNDKADTDSETEATVTTTTKATTKASMPFWMRGTFVASANGGLNATFASKKTTLITEATSKDTCDSDDSNDSNNNNNESDDDDNGRDYSMRITDAELFAACEGRTARKGARVEQPAKLARVEVLATTNATVTAKSTKTVTTNVTLASLDDHLLPKNEVLASQQSQEASMCMTKKKKRQRDSDTDTKNVTKKKKDKKTKKDKKEKRKKNKE
ncbi:hypothetical protein BDF19DRAFT_410541 [Syncephalis fuscata]|nr:hypothetical protein BDF19DRAFT_410541 [Syncephalis fuscata]